MKKFLLGLFVGLALPIIKTEYDFKQYAKHNPDDPLVMDHQEKYGTFKDDCHKLVNQMKAAWNQAKTDSDFKDIVKDISND